MNIKILHGVEGAKEATGIAVIIDVFRAFTVEAYLINNGAEKLIAVGDMQIAYDYKAQNNDCILIGERKGKILPGFDYGNSPSQIQNVDFSGKTVIHTTSNGTQGIANAKNAEEVSLVAMGSRTHTEEDNLCAYYIRSVLENTEIDLEKEIENVKEKSGAKFFDKDQQEVFPKEDFYLSTEIDKFNFILKVIKSQDEFNYVEKIELE